MAVKYTNVLLKPNTQVLLLNEVPWSLLWHVCFIQPGLMRDLGLWSVQIRGTRGFGSCQDGGLWTGVCVCKLGPVLFLLVGLIRMEEAHDKKHIDIRDTDKIRHIKEAFSLFIQRPGNKYTFYF